MTRFILPLLAGFLAGCGQGGPKTHAVAGKVELGGGDVSALAGSSVEVALATDPSVGPGVRDWTTGRRGRLHKPWLQPR